MGTWFSAEFGSAGLMVGLDDLVGLLMILWFDDSTTESLVMVMVVARAGRWH